MHNLEKHITSSSSGFDKWSSKAANVDSNLIGAIQWCFFRFESCRKLWEQWQQRRPILHSVSLDVRTRSTTLFVDRPACWLQKISYGRQKRKQDGNRQGIEPVESVNIESTFRLSDTILRQFTCRKVTQKDETWRSQLWSSNLFRILTNFDFFTTLFDDKERVIVLSRSQNDYRFIFEFITFQ
jgi:hypothetical protein